MREYKKKKIKIIALAALLLFPFVMTYLSTNFELDFFHGQDKGVHVIESKATEKIESNSAIIYDLDNIYVDKIRIVFNSENEESYLLKIDGYNDFDYNDYTERSVSSNSFISEETINIGKVVKRIELVDEDGDYNDLPELYIYNVSDFNLYYFFFFSMLSISVGYLGYNWLEKRLKLENAFLVVYICVTLTMIVSYPKIAHWTPDSEIHFQYAWRQSFLKTEQYSYSYYENIRVPYPTIPDTKETQKILDMELDNPSNTEYYSSVYKGIFTRYNYIDYYPASIGLFLGRTLRLPFTFTYMLGKITSALAIGLISYAAVKIAKKGKALVMTIALIPTSVFLAAQYSLDGLVNSCLLLASVLYINQMIDRRDKVTFGWTIAYLSMITIACLAKPVYAPLVLLPVVFKADKFVGIRQKNIYKLSLFFVFFTLMFILIIPVLNSVSAGVSDLRGGYTSAIGQLASLLTHPFYFVKMYVWTYISSFGDYIFAHDAFVGAYYQESLSGTFYLLLLIQYVILTFAGWELSEKIKNSSKLFLGLLISVVIMFIFGSMHLSFTPVGMDVINGVQIRYFTPLFLLISFVFAGNKVKLNFHRNNMNLVLISISTIAVFAFSYFVVLSTFCN